MDFNSLLNIAQQNKLSTNDGNYYRTKFEPPKKETKEKKLSSNIQKFLVQRQKDEEEKEKMAKLRRAEMQAKRDPKAQRKIEKMLKVIKSANKTEQGVPNSVEDQQPDEDDYGFVSNESSSLYNKLMEKYQKLPEDKKFAPTSHRNRPLTR